MSEQKICLSCCRRGGRQSGCKTCPLLAPTPRHQVVRNIIERVGHEHRLEQLAADEQFKADLRGLKDSYEERRAQKNLCRRQKRRERQALSQAAKNSMEEA